jgi:hypothetical protein
VVFRFFDFDWDRIAVLVDPIQPEIMVWWLLARTSACSVSFLLRRETVWAWDWLDFTARIVVGGVFMIAAIFGLAPFPLRNGKCLTQVPEPAGIRHVAAGPIGHVAVRRMRRATAL